MSDNGPDLAFVRVKSRHVVTWSLANVQRLHEHRCATMPLGRPLEGRTAIVCGASYALTRNGEYLREAKRRGAALIATNSSAQVLERHYGVTPDVLVARESIDVSDQVRESAAPLVCLDLCAHPYAWDAAGDRLAWFIPGYPRHMHIAQALSASRPHLPAIRLLYGGSASFTSAVKLAIEWGASRVVLVGAGLALIADERGVLRAYHPAAPRGGLRAYERDGALHHEGNEADDERAIRSGQTPPPRVVRYARVPSHDWREMLPIIDTLHDEREWLQIEAGRHGGQRALLNASEAGAGVVGWQNVALRDVVDSIEVAEPCAVELARPVSQRENERIVVELRREAEWLIQSAEEMLRPGGPRLGEIASLPGIVYGAPLIEALAAWRIVDAPEDPMERCRWVHQAYVDAAREALRVLSGRAEVAA